MKDGFSTRRLSVEDWEAFAALRLSALQECPGMFGSSYAKEKENTPEQWKAWLGYEDGAVFGLFDQTNLIGITGIRPENLLPHAGFLIASYIKPDYRGKGLSDLLYRARIEWARDCTNWSTLTISHRDGNEASRRANQRHGFVYTHRLSKTWPDGVTADDICYELNLEKLRQSI